MMQQRHLPRHHKTVHRDPSRFCQYCNKYVLKGEMNAHKEVCLEQKTFECDDETCNRRFETLLGKIQHVDKVHVKEYMK